MSNQSPATVHEYRLNLDVPVDLTDLEFATAAVNLADEEIALGEIKAEKTLVVGEFNTRIKFKIGRVRVLAKQVKTKAEVRTVDCLMRLDLDNGETTITRMDTNPPQVIERRPMTPEERQTALQFMGDGGAAPPEMVASVQESFPGLVDCSCGKYLHFEHVQGWLHDDGSKHCDGAKLPANEKENGK